MSAPLVESSTLQSVLEAEGNRVAATPVACLANEVPNMGGWCVEDVVRHTARVHLWAAEMLRRSVSDEVPRMRDTPEVANGPRCVEEYQSSLTALLDLFEARELTEPAVTFAGPATVEWWLRRQAHEVTVHRFDIDSALDGEPAPANPHAAADGVDEWCHLMVPRAVSRYARQHGGIPVGLAGKTVHLHGTDTDHAEWMLTIGDAGVTVTREHGKGDVAIRGGAQDLLLAMWRRQSLDGFQMFGDPQVARHLLEVVRL